MVSCSGYLKPLNKRRFRTALFVAVLVAFFLCLPGQSLYAAPTETLEITGDGVAAPLTLTLAQLQEMPQYEHPYSVINTFPTKQWYVARGVKLRDLLDAAGLTPEAKLLHFISNDGYEVTLTVKELLLDQRNYYPYLKDNHPSDGSIPGSARAAQAVEPILALVSAEGEDDPAAMNGRDALLLVLGQRDVTEQTNNLFLKYVSRIEVLTEEPLQWDAPKADIDSGEVPAGTPVTLSNRKGDIDKIYYTTDGSEPTVHSAMFNKISSRWLLQRDGWELVNLPIEVNEDVVIKAITIGPGRTDSEVVTFTYQADFTGKEIDLQRGKAPGVSLDQPTLGLKPGASAELSVNANWGQGREQVLFYSSSDTSVVTVDGQGLVTRVGRGAATVTVRSADGQYTALCLVLDPEQPDAEAAALIASNNGTPLGQPDFSEEAANVAVDAVAPEPLAEPAPADPEPEPPPIPEGRGQFLAEARSLVAPTFAELQVLSPEWRIFELTLGASPNPTLPTPSPMNTYMLYLVLVCLAVGAVEKYYGYTKELKYR